MRCTVAPDRQVDFPKAPDPYAQVTKLRHEDPVAMLRPQDHFQPEVPDRRQRRLRHFFAQRKVGEGPTDDDVIGLERDSGRQTFADVSQIVPQNISRSGNLSYQFSKVVNQLFNPRADPIENSSLEFDSLLEY